MDGAHRLGILCVASKALPRSHVAASLLSLRSQLNCHPLETSDLQSKRASPSLTSSHFVFFIALSLSDTLLLAHYLSPPVRMKAP